MTMVELLVVMGVAVLVMGIILFAVARVRKASQSVVCLSNLRIIGSAFKLYAADYGGILPPSADVAGHTFEQLLTDFPVDAPYIADSFVFRCPADEEIYPILGSSYDWRDTGNPTTTLAGKPYGSNMDLRGNPVLAMEQMPGWHAKKQMNAVFLDGSAQEMSQDDCLKDLLTPIRSDSGTSGN